MVNTDDAGTDAGRPQARSVERVGVVGGGQMGAGIAEVCARRGLDVVVREVNESLATAAHERIGASLERATAAGKIDARDADAALARIAASASWDAFAAVDLVVEAIIEDEAHKIETFRHLDDIVPDQTVLATNTSSIPIARIAAATDRPEWVIGMHFFNPVPVLALVELIPSLRTNDAARTTAAAFAERLGKQVIWCDDRAGFVVNALLVPYLLSAIRMVQDGIATAQDVDTGMVAGCAHPMGPLRLADLVGLDTTKAVADSLYAEYAQPHLAAPPLLSRMVEAGLLGRKSGQGFYRYE